jgi:hypothetical protein
MTDTFINNAPPAAAPQSATTETTAPQPTVTDIDNMSEADMIERLNDLGAPSSTQPQAEPAPTTEPDPEAEKLLEDDQLLEQYKILTESGYTPEEARQKIYGEEVQEQQPQQLPQIDQNYLVPKENYQLLVNEYHNPTLKGISFFLRNDPEMKSIYPGNFTDDELVEVIRARPDFKHLLINSYRSRLAPEIQQIETQYNNAEQIQQANNTLVAGFEKDFLKDFPEFNEANPSTNALGSHFVFAILKKIEKLPVSERNNAKILEAIYKTEKEKFKKTLPTLKQKLGIDVTNPNTDVLTKQKLLEMQQSGTTPTNSGNSRTFTKLDPYGHSEKEVVDALEDYFNAQK